MGSIQNWVWKGWIDGDARTGGPKTAENTIWSGLTHVRCRISVHFKCVRHLFSINETFKAQIWGQTELVTLFSKWLKDRGWLKEWGNTVVVLWLLFTCQMLSRMWRMCRRRRWRRCPRHIRHLRQQHFRDTTGTEEVRYELFNPSSNEIISCSPN